MNPEQKKFLNECADLAKRFNRLYEAGAGLCSIDSDIGDARVMLMEDDFLRYFGDSFEVKDRHDKEYPWKLVHRENGVSFFCITDRNIKAGGSLQRRDDHDQTRTAESL